MHARRAVRTGFAAAEPAPPVSPTSLPGLEASAPDDRLTGSGPNALPEAQFLALDGDRYVGISALYRPLAQPGVISQGLTGVLREYRGRGIAMALKLQTVRYAREGGYREIRTWNDARNRPMLRINEALGFVKQPATITFEKSLVPPGESEGGG